MKRVIKSLTVLAISVSAFTSIQALALPLVLNEDFKDVYTSCAESKMRQTPEIMVPQCLSALENVCENSDSSKEEKCESKMHSETALVAEVTCDIFGVGSGSCDRAINILSRLS